jgi:5'-phosphate synthase pdxT subunit
MNKVVGVLALQGAYQKHVESLSRLGVESRLVRKAAELDGCSALIIPGGESTTISLLMQEYDMYEPIKKFAETHPVMGVCAGMIMMANEVDDYRVKPLGIMPFKALRNHFGRQVHSFTADIELEFNDNDAPFSAQFIRAPGIENPSPETQVLATYDNEAVMIGTGKHVALSFHPELTGDTRVHDYWLSRF